MSHCIKKNINIRSKDCNKKRLCEPKVCINNNHFEVSKSLTTCCGCGGGNAGVGEDLDYLVTEPTGCQFLGFDDTLEKWVNLDQPYEVDDNLNIKPCNNESKNIIGDGSFSTISGGRLNIMTGDGSAISGGTANEMSGDFSTIGGGFDNEVVGNNSAIGGGFLNKVESTSSNVCGGEANEVLSAHSSVLGGNLNKIQGAGAFNAIVGGEQNTMEDGVARSVVVGGSSNTVGNGASRSVIIGGVRNAIIPGIKNSVILGCNDLIAGSDNTAYMCNANIKETVCLELALIPDSNSELVVRRKSDGKFVTPNQDNADPKVGELVLPGAAGFIVVCVDGVDRKMAFWDFK